MTDKDIADHVYIEPLTLDMVKRVISINLSNKKAVSCGPAHASG